MIRSVDDVIERCPAADYSSSSQAIAKHVHGNAKLSAAKR
jgi:hypothetical protein